METKICTSVEQSKKLIELGIDIDTSDMVYLKSYFLDEEEEDYNLLVGSYHEGYAEKDDGSLIPVFDEHIPAWSLPALLNIIADVNCIWLGTNDAAAWQCELNLGGRDHHNTTQYNNPLDAAFEMVCWLKENNEL